MLIVCVYCLQVVGCYDSYEDLKMHCLGCQLESSRCKNVNLDFTHHVFVACSACGGNWEVKEVKRC
jgi:hypothetical protein